jgi:chromate transporter
LSILCAWSVAGLPGALVGGIAFITPGLIAIIALSSVFLASSAPQWVLAAGAGASSSLAIVALHSGFTLIPASWRRTPSRPRWSVYVVAGICTAVLAGSWVVVVLIACGVTEVLVRRVRNVSMSMAPVFALATAMNMDTVRDGITGSLVWTAFKVGALSYGGGFVIIPLIFNDAVERFAWMTESQFLDAVVLGQITPGPVVHTMSAVGFAAGGISGALVAALVAFGPSFVFVGFGARHFDKIRLNVSIRSFLDGAGPAAIGAIIGVAIPLAVNLSEQWQFVFVALSALVVFVVKRSTFFTLVLMAALGVVVVQAGMSLPS